jgi:hypothetical protein
MKVIRVFPRRTNLTPTDPLAFVGDPPLWRPEADEVHVSCTFTWDKPKAERLAKAWGQYYPVKLGGVAYDDLCETFIPGMYVKHGVTFTSRGCNFQCPWCLVPKREGKLRQIENFAEGNIIQDNNFLQCNKSHTDKVYQMLRKQKRIEFSGGLDARLFKWDDAEQMRSLNIYQLFFASDTKGSIYSLRNAGALLKGLDRRKLRCYVLLAFNGQTISEAIEHLEDVWAAGFMPHAQLYQPPDSLINYSQEWRELSRRWTRPAIMQTMNGKDKVLVEARIKGDVY